MPAAARFARAGARHWPPRMRLVLESGEASVGLLEWKVWAIPPD